MADPLICAAIVGSIRLTVNASKHVVAKLPIRVLVERISDRILWIYVITCAVLPDLKYQFNRLLNLATCTEHPKRTESSGLLKFISTFSSGLAVHA